MSAGWWRGKRNERSPRSKRAGRREARAGRRSKTQGRQFESLERRALLAAPGPETMQYNGGPLLTNVKVEGVYYSPWDSDPALQAQQQYMDQFFNFFTKSAYIDQLLTPFSVNAQVNNTGQIVPVPGETAQIIGHGSFIGNDFNGIQVPGNPKNTPGGYGVLDDSDIQAMLESEFLKGDIPAPDGNTLYYVFAPPNTEVTAFGENSITGFLGYHFDFTDSSNNTFYYAVMPYPASPNTDLGSYVPAPANEPFDTLTPVASHEISEAITDPIPQAGWSDMGTFGENEIADKAVYVAPLFRMSDPFPNPPSIPPASNNYDVQQEWAHVDGPPQAVTTTGVYIPFLNYQAVEGLYSGVVGSFVDLDGDTDPADFSVEVDWGDGRTSKTSGTTPANKLTVSSVGNGTFTVIGTHAYSTALPEGESNNFLNMIVSDKTPADVPIANGSVFLGISPTIFDANSGTLSNVNGTYVGDYVKFTSGPLLGQQRQISGYVGFFDEFTFVDGFSATPGIGDTFEILPTASQDTTQDTQILITDAPLTAVPTSVAATEGQALANTVVGAFTDPGSDGDPSDYLATVTWDDGNGATHTSQGTLVPAGFVAGVEEFNIIASNNVAYSEEGPHAVTIVVEDKGGLSTTITSTINVIDLPVLITSHPINTTEGTLVNQVIGTFTDPGGNEAPADYQATIAWGDGTITSGTITSNTGVFTVSGSHTYAEEANTALTLSIQDTPAAAQGTVNVGTSATSFTAFTAGLSPIDGFYLNEYAQFTTGALKGQSAQIIGYTGAGTFTFAAGGFSQAPASGDSFVIGGPTATATVTAGVAYAPLSVTALAINPVEKGVFNGQVGSFTQPAANEPQSNYQATIAWGDGTSSQGTINFSGGTYLVSGSHTYAEEGNYTLTLTGQNEPGIVPLASVNAGATSTTFSAGGGTLSGIDGAYVNDYVLFTSGALSGQWSKISGYTASTHTLTLASALSAAPGAGDTFQIGGILASNTSTSTVSGLPLSVIPLSISSSEGAMFNGLVATFTDPGGNEAPSAYTATIAWGDGSVSAGTVTTAGDGTLTVSGSHNYSEEGSPSATVTIQHPFTPAATATVPASIVDVPIAATGGATFTATEGALSAFGTVATFTDPGGNETPSDYTAAINWGDGTSIAPDITIGTVVFNSGTGQWNVTGAHQYAEERQYPISVAITHDSLAAVTVPSLGVVADATPVANGGFTFLATEGTASSPQTVATFVDPAGPEQITDYSATILWGDGTTTNSAPGDITLGADNTFTVQGSHLYAVDTPANPISVIIHHDFASNVTATSTPKIIDPSVNSGAAMTITATEGAASSPQAVATFTDPAGADAISDYSATISWGDGGTSAGTITQANGTFTVSGSHLYANEGTEQMTVTLHHDTAADVTVSAFANVIDPPVTPTGGFTFTATEGAVAASQVLATFTDPGGATPAAAAEVLNDYAASVAWGDGATTQGTISVDANGRFTVTGAHLYASEGQFTIDVALGHDNAAVATAASTAQVADTPLAPVGGLPLNMVEGIPSTVGPLISFTDPGGNEPAANYTATINWGDGTTPLTGNGTVGFDDLKRIFTVNGTHTYAEENRLGQSYQAIVTIHHGTASDISASVLINVADPSPAATGGYTFSASEGQVSSPQSVATFRDPGGAETPADYGATILWGDGSASPGAINGPDANGVFTVSGSHVYAEEGTKSVQVLIAHDAAPTVTVASQSAVADVPVALSGGLTINAVEGATSVSQALATFSDPGGTEPPADYSATVAWGDGTSSSGSISYGATTGQFTVFGTHRYAEEGTPTITVTVHHDTAVDASATSQANVVDAPLLPNGGFTFVATEGVTSSAQTVASFADPGGNETPADYSATINWGGGTVSQGTIGFDTVSGQFTVAGDHLYATAGPQPITVTIQHDSAPTVTVVSTAQVADQAVLATGNQTLQALEDVVTSLQPVATFTDPAGPQPASDYSAQIDWGDGSVSSGSIVQGASNANSYTVLGQHVYMTEGTAVITVTVLHGTAPNVTVTSAARIADAPVVAQGGLSISATSGVPLVRQTVATFYDPVGVDPLAVYSANINWGDGPSVSAASLSYNAATNRFTVSGDHTYASGGQFTITVTIHHETALDTTTTSQATVSGPPFAATLASITASETVPFNGVVATLSGATANGLSAMISWGDGTTTLGTVSGNLGQVSGAHVYSDEGSFPVTVTVVDAGTSLVLSGNAAVAPAPLPVANPTPNQFFIAEVYEDLLGRPVDPGGLAFWTAQLDAGSPRAAVSQQLVQTDEYFATIIRPAYQEFLFRQPDAAGLAFWTMQMGHGLTDEQLQAGFIGAPEYFERRGGNTNAGWLLAMYQDLLHRAPDTNGENFWLIQLAAGETRTQVALGFTSSPEREGDWASDLYFHYLDRAPQPSESAQVVTEITQQGLTREDVIALTISTDEYFTRSLGDAVG